MKKTAEQETLRNYKNDKYQCSRRPQPAQTLKSIFLLFSVLFYSNLASPTIAAEIFEDLDPEYSISSVQADFLPWWQNDWEETITGLRIMGSSFDLHTIHALQHWKGIFPFNDYFLFSFTYYNDATAEGQFYEREMELKWRVRGKNYISLFGYPYYDKKESDIGIRYSFEETPLDFIRFSLLFENAPNNYTFKSRDMDSMRIYKKIPVQFSFDMSLIKKHENRLVLSYSIGTPYTLDYENKNGEILYSMEGEKSGVKMEQRVIYDGSNEFGWRILFYYVHKKFFSNVGLLDSTTKYIHIRPDFYITKKINPAYTLLFLYRYDLEETTNTMNTGRKTVLLGISRNISTHSKIGLSYCNGITNNIEGSKRADNRLILSAEHKFKNRSRVGMNLGIELDTRDTTHGFLGRYDKLFFFIQHPFNQVDVLN